MIGYIIGYTCDTYAHYWPLALNGSQNLGRTATINLGHSDTISGQSNLLRWLHHLKSFTFFSGSTIAVSFV